MKYAHSQLLNAAWREFEVRGQRGCCKNGNKGHEKAICRREIAATPIAWLVSVLSRKYFHKVFVVWRRSSLRLPSTQGVSRGHWSFARMRRFWRSILSRFGRFRGGWPAA